MTTGWRPGRTRGALTLVAVVAMMVELCPARAAWAAPEEGTEEANRAFVGALLGAAAYAGAGLIVALFASGPPQEGSADVALVAVLAAPAVAGAITCRYQNRSHRYRASCGLPILAAYAGATAGLGATVGIYASSHPSGITHVFAFAPLVLLPSTSAALTWSLVKQPYEAAPSERTGPDPRPAFERRSRRGVGTPAFVLPLVAARF
jgi:hypothetical protein